MTPVTVKAGLLLGLFIAVLPAASALAATVHAGADAGGVTADVAFGAPLEVGASATVAVPALAGDAHAPGEDARPAAHADDAETATADGEPLARMTWTREDAAKRALAGPGLYLAAHVLARVLGSGAMGLGLFPGYARITRSDVLENAHRDRVYKILRERPGLSATDVQNLTGLGWGTTVYHLDRLQRTGLVTSERSGLARRYYPTADVPHTERRARAVLDRPQLSALARHILSAPGLAQKELAERAGLSKSAAAKQLAALEDAGLVAREREGRVARVNPTDTLQALSTP